ncbi:MAG: hypothetical protein HQL27_01415, partial [Candidatus Omnitrophica bacterium]|nr:hypothetical protein [Candidatus Omnitrophota bacterium]
NYEGGGLRYSSSNSIHFIKKNLIHDNSSVGDGGGINISGYSDYSLANNTIANNSSQDAGGGIYVNNQFNLSLLNDIVWGNHANESLSIHCSGFYCSEEAMSINYSDSEEFPEFVNGVGNISADPLFVNQENGDFHLLRSSPCIDSGDPNSPRDPDGTRADMGAYYFHKVKPPKIEHAVMVPR